MTDLTLTWSAVDTGNARKRCAPVQTNSRHTLRATWIGETALCAPAENDFARSLSRPAPITGRSQKNTHLRKQWQPLGEWREEHGFLSDSRGESIRSSAEKVKPYLRPTRVYITDSEQDVPTHISTDRQRLPRVFVTESAQDFSSQDASDEYHSKKKRI